MNRKKILWIAPLVLVCLLLAYVLIEAFTVPPGTRDPASIPNNYEYMQACEKQDFLWNKVQQTTYQELPDYRKFKAPQLLALSLQKISTKGDLLSDFAPRGWKKLLHGRAAMAKVKIVPKNTKYTGIFKGSECSLLRLSLTFKPTSSLGVAPGLALKVLRDGASSANISALVSLGGQGQNFNFFQSAMSNIVPVGTSFGQKAVHKIFSTVSKYPEELLLSDMAALDSHGKSTQNVVSPRQLFFIPSGDLKFSTEPHDVREDFLLIPPGTLVYRIFAVSEVPEKFEYSKFEPKHVADLIKGSEHIADIVTTSEFVASEFGDDGIFFKHQLRP